MEKLKLRVSTLVLLFPVDQIKASDNSMDHASQINYALLLWNNAAF